MQTKQHLLQTVPTEQKSVKLEHSKNQAGQTKERWCKDQPR
jgi:hypothetical protein